MVGGASGVQMNIKILNLQSVLQKHEALPIPTQARCGKPCYVLHILCPYLFPFSLLYLSLEGDTNEVNLEK